MEWPHEINGAKHASESRVPPSLHRIMIGIVVRARRRLNTRPRAPSNPLARWLRNPLNGENREDVVSQALDALDLHTP